MPDMNKTNNMDTVPIADIPERDLEQIKSLEQKLGNKYYLIAFAKE